MNMNVIEKWLSNLIFSHGIHCVYEDFMEKPMSETFQSKVVLIGKGLEPCLLAILPPS